MSTNYTYDGGNRVTQVQEKDASNVVTTTTITRTYDGLDRMTQEVTPQETVNYTYDNASRGRWMGHCLTLHHRRHGHRSLESHHDLRL